MYWHLAVTGPQRGHLWLTDESDESGAPLAPMEPDDVAAAYIQA